LTSRGFTGVDGKPLQPQSVRRLWLRVKERHAKAQAGKKPKPAAKPAPVVTTEAASEPADPNDALARIRSKINKHSGRTE
jgi:hypothetical protein